MALHRRIPEPRPTIEIRPQLAGDTDVDEVPRNRIPDNGIEARAAYQLVHDELMLDGNARLNLATFVTTWMEPEARLLIEECLDRNIVDKDEYPQSAELESRCVHMLADLWGSPKEDDPTGCSTTGSSEGCMLGGMALLRRWRQRRGDRGGRPNLVMGANVQVCWEKFCRYWDVEPRLVPVSLEHTHLTPERAVEHCDENTIGVVAILGSTFDGTYEPVHEIAAALDDLESDRGIDVPIHVDAASGGFIAPFLDPDLVWDFRLPRVKSINASGHKYGHVYPGVGWVLWRDSESLPEELVFRVDYLGGDMPTFSLNFSRPGAQVAAQYYNLVRLGRDGYTRVQQNCRSNAKWLAEQVGALDDFETLSDGSGIPAFAFRLRDGIDAYTVYDVSEALRTRGWLVPAYRMPKDIEDVSVLRMVIRTGFTRDLAEILIDDLQRMVGRLEQRGGFGDETPSFHH
jgi:glutamate decarboxylase